MIPNNEEINLGTVGILPNHESFQITHQSHIRQKCMHGFHEPKLQLKQAKIPHVEQVMGRWYQTKSSKHPKLAVEVALCHKTYNKMGLQAPNAEKKQHTTRTMCRQTF